MSRVTIDGRRTVIKIMHRSLERLALLGQRGRKYASRQAHAVWKSRQTRIWCRRTNNAFNCNVEDTFLRGCESEKKRLNTLHGTSQDWPTLIEL